MAVATHTKQTTGGQVPEVKPSQVVPLDEAPIVIIIPRDVIESDQEVLRLKAAITELDERIAKAERIAGDETLSVNDLVNAQTEIVSCRNVRGGLEATLKAAKRRALDRRADEAEAEARKLRGRIQTIKDSVAKDFEAFRTIVAETLNNGDPSYTLTEIQTDAAIAGFTAWLPAAVRVARLRLRAIHLENAVPNLRMTGRDSRYGEC